MLRGVIAVGEFWFVHCAAGSDGEKERLDCKLNLQG